MKINANTCDSYRRDVKNALKAVEERYGVSISLGTISYSGTEMRVKLTAVGGESSDVTSPTKGFAVGNIVGINHKTFSPSQKFRVIKINNKSIKIQEISTGRLINCGKSFLFHQTK
jgi:phosphopentomutase